MEKKLTIEEKAKAYDGNYKAYTELINRLEDVKEAIKKQNYGNAMDILCKPYPEFQITTSTELKESEDSEDEKTRTKLLNLLKELLELGGVAQDTWSMNDCEQFIAWLEKQGEQTEAQAENNLPSFDEAQGTIIVERQYEQKPADKVEPKFKVGDWVVHDMSDGRKAIRQIVNMTNKSYVLDGEDFNIFYFNDLEDDYHLWTIQDAKDGDVLCYTGEISLYKHDIKNCTKQGTTFGGFVYHCCYDGKRFITDSLYSLTEQDEMDIHPATQEQRSLLFQKMREAGYEWNAEKKELKKIERKSTEWDEEDERYLSYAIHAVEDMLGNNGKNTVTWLKSLKDRYTWKPSDEQIKALEYYIYSNSPTATITKGTIFGNIMVELLKQLKKLREK